MSKTVMWGIVVVAFIVGIFAGYFVEKSRATAKMESYKMDVQKQLDDAKKMAEKTTDMMKDQQEMKSGGLVMMVNSATLGQYVAAPNNMTLYTYDKDSANQSNCYDKCATNWPPYVVSGSVLPKLPEYMGTTKRTDGQMQYTWNGKPLYYYIGDKKAGDVTGDGVGGVWHVAK